MGVPRNTPLIDRVANKVTIVDDCWVWIGARNIHGYGEVSVNGRGVGAHRAVYELFVGPIPEGLQIDHLCRNRACVNPGHLEPVTQKENIRRGKSPSALHAVKTHCPQGHAYMGENLGVRRTGERYCRCCNRERVRTYRH